MFFYISQLWFLSILRFPIKRTFFLFFQRKLRNKQIKSTKSFPAFHHNYNSNKFAIKKSIGFFPYRTEIWQNVKIFLHKREQCKQIFSGCTIFLRYYALFTSIIFIYLRECFGSSALCILCGCLVQQPGKLPL